jgi:hypothetical protein
MASLVGESTTQEEAAVKGVNTGSGGFAVWGICATGHGVHGESTSGRGVVGVSDGFQGVYGKSRGNAGVVGESDELHGVYGDCHNPHGAGIFGTNDKGGMGVEGVSPGGRGVWGHSDGGDGVFGQGRRGVVGESETFQGVYGKSRDNAGVGVFGVSHDPNGGGIFGTNDAGGFAAVFDGKVSINNHLAVVGDINGSQVHCQDVFVLGADCAEQFDVNDGDPVRAGSVMVLADEGRVRVSDVAYDKRVAGVVSGAGDYRPGVVLDCEKSLTHHRVPLALMGKVFCLVDADSAPIEVGDLLTTSAITGHAMKASEPLQAFGAIIGKALRAVRSGRGCIPILVTLQ